MLSRDFALELLQACRGKLRIGFGAMTYNRLPLNLLSADNDWVGMPKGIIQIKGDQFNGHVGSRISSAVN